MAQQPPIPDDWKASFPPGFTPQYHPPMALTIPQPPTDLHRAAPQAIVPPQSQYPGAQPGMLPTGIISQQPMGYPSSVAASAL